VLLNCEEFSATGVHAVVCQTEVLQKKYPKVGAVIEVAPFLCDLTALLGPDFEVYGRVLKLQ
jgi:hypothetical protein